jgi:hypothetical protein
MKTSWKKRLPPAIAGALVVAALLVVAWLQPAPAAEAKKEADPKDKDQQVVSSKPTKRPAAGAVPFRKDLKLPFSSLNTLGSRIDAARRAHDPVALAHTASELAVAESVSGAKSSLTSTQVVAEAAELAKLKKQVAEMQAVLKVSEKVANTDETISMLRDQIAFQKKRAEDDQKAFQASQEPTFTPRKIVVNNYTTQYIDIWVNGNYKMRVAPGLTDICVVEHRINPTTLTAYGDDDNQTWGPRQLWGRFTKYTWNINGD